MVDPLASVSGLTGASAFLVCEADDVKFRSMFKPAQVLAGVSESMELVGFYQRETNTEAG